jgi:hypothetical protein
MNVQHLIEIGPSIIHGILTREPINLYGRRKNVVVTYDAQAFGSVIIHVTWDQGFGLMRTSYCCPSSLAERLPIHPADFAEVAAHALDQSMGIEAKHRMHEANKTVTDFRANPRAPVTDGAA